MLVKFIPYHPASRDRGRQMVVTMVRIFMIRFCRMSISAWNSSRTCKQYSRSSWASSRRRPNRRSSMWNSRSSFSVKNAPSFFSNSQATSSSWV